MKCWNCNTELIWGGDQDLNDNEDYMVLTNLNCSECNSLIKVYLPRK